MVSFDLKYFSLAIEERIKNSTDKGQRFLAVCFILAAGSDKNIFPELLAHYRELDEATSDYILVISPHFKLYNSVTKQPLNRDEIFRILKNRRFDFPVESWQFLDMQPEAAIEYFMEKQETQTYEFADEFNISRSRLPCIVFFSTTRDIEKGLNGIVWSIKNQDYSSIIQDFRSIVARLKDKYGVWVTKSSELAQLEQQQNQDEMIVSMSANQIEELRQKIMSERKRIEARLRDPVEQSRLARMKESEAKRKRVYGNLDDLEGKLASTYEEKNKAESELLNIAIRIKQLKEEKSQLHPPNALTEIESLDRRRFVTEMLRVAGRSVPLVQLVTDIGGKLLGH